MIYILSAPIQTGKTTALSQIINDRQDIGGFLSPTIQGKRNLQNLQNKNLIQFEAEDPSINTISVGRFHFYKESFEKATHWTIEHCTANVSTTNIKYIIVDELGKLELKGEGFFYLAQEILKLEWVDKNLILVVRDFLVDDILNQFHIANYEIISTNDISKIFNP